MSIRQKYLVIIFSCFFIAASAFVLLATNALAAPTTMEVSWNMSAEDQAKGTFFRVFNQNNEVVADNVSRDARSAQFQTDGEKGSWRVDYILVVDGVEYLSDVSMSAVWAPEPPPCPVDPVPPTPTVYNITGTITAEPVN